MASMLDPVPDRLCMPYPVVSCSSCEYSPCVRAPPACLQVLVGADANLGVPVRDRLRAASVSLLGFLPTPYLTVVRANICACAGDSSRVRSLF